MKKIKTLFIQLATPLAPDEISQFRAAVIEATDREHNIFHNHRSDNTYYYRYPLIQYKSVNRQAALFCLEEGTDLIHHFLGKQEISLRIGKRQEALSVDRVNLQQVLLQTWSSDIEYRLFDWQALNQKNYAQWQKLEKESLSKQVAFLEKILTGNILSACKGMGFRVEERLTVKIRKLGRVSWRSFKGQSIRTFNIDFSVNLSLPEYIGLGKGASMGFGVLRTARKPKAKQSPDILATELSNSKT
ncbi:hypothetical protein FUA23_16665 [Neolewinella aurantiaca]|uniref:DNA repair protein n=1 Tax=Neolewinella aurantiaca TaxID=2602767 RepID=A0A5C7FPX4_9BACT|nr:CRISPR-associated endonuclease Cas6 [Neolewinella aurantiaca]TXF87992.1 hypothetical protein FUA23_16665 [Neolewinella aurantiaca]